MRAKLRNILVLSLIIILVVAPFFVNQNASFGGADGEAEGIIKGLAPKYKPWFGSFWTPPSGEIESLLFSLQAAVGALIIGYYIGYKRAKHEPGENSEQ
ncbi:MAG: energy-coupling factor ABC transporter substrate-binding protein [Candidatus Bipolaricaulota bacterium]|nr:energy-coupling factor ABC transporter substrate-binding protein [Candidatus Bipolaricaulota bacterium]MBS3792545.1 energy-coupling factor ABC transporter substrate-binding protein [Candidatus Bipolaricaulota bacterium]